MHKQRSFKPKILASFWWNFGPVHSIRTIALHVFNTLFPQWSLFIYTVYYFSFLINCPWKAISLFWYYIKQIMNVFFVQWGEYFHSVKVILYCLTVWISLCPAIVVWSLNAKLINCLLSPGFYVLFEFLSPRGDHLITVFLCLCVYMFICEKMTNVPNSHFV